MMKKKRMQDNDKKSIFREGITLEEYLSSVRFPEQEQLQEDEKSSEDLYETSRKFQQASKRQITTFEIKETDEDNYEEQIYERFKFRTPLDNCKSSIYEEIAIRGKFVKHETQSTENTIDHRQQKRSGNSFRVKCMSKSPPTWRKKGTIDLQKHSSFSQTLHLGQHCKSLPKTQSPSLASTIYSKLSKNQKTPTLKKKEWGMHNFVMNFSKSVPRKKNGKGPKSVEMKQKQNAHKMNAYHLPDIICMRVEGISDRLYEKKVFIGNKIK